MSVSPRRNLGEIRDDPELLRLTLDDMQHTHEIYKPGNYWQVYEQQIVRELLVHGLRDCRRRAGSFSFMIGGHDVGIPPLVPAASLQRLACAYVDSYGQHAGARPLHEWTMSLAGSPAQLFEWRGKQFTFTALYYYMQYAYACRFINFDEIDCIVELGCGMGRQVEVIKHLHPHLTYLLFDIAPIVYVAEQFLTSVFGGLVVSYRRTRTWSSLAELQRGSIHVLGTGQFPVLAERSFDLFWNSNSFQEMEPATVANYLRTVSAGAGAVFLNQFDRGQNVAVRRGQPGVLEPTTFAHYRAGLPGFELVDASACLMPDSRPFGTTNSFWRRAR